MAFDWLGTFTVGQFERFAKFAKAQRALVSARIDHLTAELSRVGTIAFAYDQGGVPKKFTADPANSYIGKLLAAYEVLGGDTFYDLNLRSSKQPVFLIKADEVSSPQVFSNGEVMGGPGLGDAESAVLLQKAHRWVDDTLDYRREYLERKIRRMLDYSDQLQAEIAVLKVITQDSTVSGSLDDLFKQVQALIETKSYRAITKSSDPFGKKAYAPFAAYNPGKDGATAVSYERTVEDGAVDPGSEGGTTT